MLFSAVCPMGNKSDGSDYQAVQLLQTTFVFGVFFLMTFFSSFNLFLSQLIFFPHLIRVSVTHSMSLLAAATFQHISD